MNVHTDLLRHPEAWVNRPEGYLRTAIEALQGGGLEVPLAWLDPCDPRDATILIGDSTRALVWDEQTGWRTGRFVAGRQGMRTELADVSYLGGGAVPAAPEVAHRLLTGTSVQRPTYRSYKDVRDGLDDLLGTISA